MQKYASNQSREYDQGVVEVLKEELMGTTKDFRRVLEVFFFISFECRLDMKTCKRQIVVDNDLVLLLLLC